MHDRGFGGGPAPAKPDPSTLLVGFWALLDDAADGGAYSYDISALRETEHDFLRARHRAGRLPEGWTQAGVISAASQDPGPTLTMNNSGRRVAWYGSGNVITSHPSLADD